SLTRSTGDLRLPANSGRRKLGMTDNYWTRLGRGALSRRRLVRGSALAGFGAAAWAAVGCGDDDNKSSPATAAGGSTKAASGSPASGATSGGSTDAVDGVVWLQNKPDLSLAPKPGGTLKYGTYIRAPTLDVIKSSSFESSNIWTPVYSWLFR